MRKKKTTVPENEYLIVYSIKKEDGGRKLIRAKIPEGVIIPYIESQTPPDVPEIVLAKLLQNVEEDFFNGR